MEPRVFIGCSSEALQIAEYIQWKLQGVATFDVWNQGLFTAGNYVLETLLEIVRKYDFAIFIFTPDDVEEIRGKKFLVARDNVLFEAGLFFTHLGRQRTLLVAPSSVPGQGLDFHLPSDLAGLILIKYKPSINPDTNPDDLGSNLGPVCFEITKSIKKEGQLTNANIKHMLEALSGGMIYILRHLDIDSFELNHLARILIELNYISGSQINEGWKKAAKYAIQVLMAFKLAERDNQCNELRWKITNEGRAFISNPVVKQYFNRTIGRPLVTEF